MSKVTHVVVDGSNIATEGRSTPSLAQLEDAVGELRRDMPEAELIVVVDATFAHRIDESERPSFEAAAMRRDYVSPPAGAIGRGDAFLLRIAQKVDATVLSNDSFQEFHGEHPWLFDTGRLLGAMPVPAIGWIFVPRSPVRGPKSHVAVRDAEKAKSKVEKAIAVATKEAVEPAAERPSKRKGDVESSDGPAARTRSPQAVNDPLTFISFVASYPLGVTVEGEVQSFTSHGAIVGVGDMLCYVPLSGLGDPAPRSAREVLRRDELREFVVTALDPQRRGAELALPEVAVVSGRPSEEMVEAEVAMTKPKAKRRGKKVAGGALDGDQAGPVDEGFDGVPSRPVLTLVSGDGDDSAPPAKPKTRASKRNAPPPVSAEPVSEETVTVVPGRRGSSSSPAALEAEPVEPSKRARGRKAAAPPVAAEAVPTPAPAPARRSRGSGRGGAATTGARAVAAAADQGDGAATEQAPAATGAGRRRRTSSTGATTAAATTTPASEPASDPHSASGPAAGSRSNSGRGRRTAPPASGTTSAPQPSIGSRRRTAPPAPDAAPTATGGRPGSRVSKAAAAATPATTSRRTPRTARTAQTADGEVEAAVPTTPATRARKSAKATPTEAGEAVGAQQPVGKRSSAGRSSGARRGSARSVAADTSS